MYGSGLRVTQLHYVAAVADLGSFSRAAAALGVTQPAMSSGIAQAERLLGGRLFNRTTKGASLTSLGLLALPLVHETLGSLHTLITDVQQASGRDPEPLRLGISPLIHPALVARAFEAVRLVLEGGVVLKEDNLASLRAALVGRDLDLVLVPAVTQDWGGARREIHEETMHYLPSSASERREASSRVEVSELTGEMLVLVVDQCGLTTFTRSLFDECGAELNPYSGDAYSYTKLVEWVGLGLGGALLPESKLDSASGLGHPLVRNGRRVSIRYEALWFPQAARGPEIELLLDAMAATSGSSR